MAPLDAVADNRWDARQAQCRLGNVLLRPRQDAFPESIAFQRRRVWADQHAVPA
jgi:hypothetical protein